MFTSPPQQSALTVIPEAGPSTDLLYFVEGSQSSASEITGSNPVAILEAIEILHTKHLGVR
jgi:hypothetical protein